MDAGLKDEYDDALEALLDEAIQHGVTMQCFEFRGKFFEVRVTPLRTMTIAEYLAARQPDVDHA